MNLSHALYLLKEEENTEFTDNETKCECLICHDTIDSQNKIKLPCNHEFHYDCLYNEIYYQKSNKPKIAQFTCPYCRIKYKNTIPYNERFTEYKLNYINYNQKTVLPLYQCEWAYKKNIKCNNPGHIFLNHTYCIKHNNQYKKNKLKESTKKPISMCNAICLNGNKCKNKEKIDGLCGIHYKKKINNLNHTILNE